MQNNLAEYVIKAFDWCLNTAVSTDSGYNYETYPLAVEASGLDAERRKWFLAILELKLAGVEPHTVLKNRDEIMTALKQYYT